MLSVIESIKSDLRLFKMRRIHSRATLHRNVVIDKFTTLDDNVVLFQNVNLSECHIGRFTYIQAYTYCHNVEIGPFCSIAFGAVIGLLNHPLKYVSTSPVFYDNSQPLRKFFTNHFIKTTNYPRTVISADVWIGHGAKIMAGVEIGVGAVVAAGAVVVKNVAPYEIVGGIPAKTIGYRFNKELAEQLLKTKWWEYSDRKIETLSHLFFDPVDFISYEKRLY